MILTSKHPLLELSMEFAQLCQPLLSFHVHHVTYQKQFKDGSRVSLSNHPQWLEDYYNLNLYQSSLFEASPSQYQSDFGVWLGEYDLDVYQHGRQYYNSYYSITITEPVADGCEFYIFGSAAKHLPAMHYLANNMEILFHFILYLKACGEELFKKANRYKISSSQFTNKKNNLLPEKSYFENLDNLKKQFFKNTPIYGYLFEGGDNTGVHLTQRELQCLRYLLNNKTAKETAILMNVSSRTVESYLDNIKNKLRCNDKLGVLNKLKNNRFLLSIS